MRLGGLDRANAVADSIRAAQGSAEVFVADLTDQSASDRLISGVVAKFGRLDVLINNAGDPLRRATVSEVDEDLLDRTLAVNFKGSFFMCRYAIEPLAKTAGNIVMSLPRSLGAWVRAAICTMLARRAPSTFLHPGWQLNSGRADSCELCGPRRR